MTPHPLWALIAVRSGMGKKRLSGLLDEEQRARIVRAMIGDVLGALAASPSVDGVAVTTADPELAALAQSHGARIIPEEGTSGLNGALERAGAILAADGASSLLIMHADVPEVTSADVEALVARHNGAVTIARAESDGGTNALLLSPPDVIRLHFGAESCAAHLAAAHEAGIAADALAIAGLSRDIDNPEDLRRLARGPNCGEAAKLAREFGIAAEGD